MQFSIDSAAHTGIPLSYQERRIWHLNSEVDRIVGRDRIPEPLRVDNLLRDYVVS